VAVSTCEFDLVAAAYSSRMSEVTWSIDAPGQWALDRSHMPAGTTAITQHISTLSMPRGMRRVFRELGVPADSIEARFVHGHMYTRLRPLIGADRPSGKLPPTAVLWLAMRLHPEMRRRTKAAEAALRDEPWVPVIDEWQHGGRDRIEAQNLALQDVELSSLEDGSLLEHVRHCIDHCSASFEHHFWLHGFDLGPIGMLLHESGAWGLDSAEVLPLLEGASPSTSAPSRQLVSIREAIEASGVHPTSLDDVRAVSPDVTAMLDHYLRIRGWLLFSRYDLDGVTLGERPDLVLASILNAEVHDHSAAVAERTAAVRAKVPEQYRAAFDERLRQARQAMDLRDDNGPMTAEWPMGLLRRALLALADRRLVSGDLAERDHVFELTVEEIERGELPGADVLARRAEERRSRQTLIAPRLLGPAEPSPPLTVMPAPLRQMVEVVQTVIAQMGMDGTVAQSGLHGAGIGSTSVRGRARVADSPEAALDAMDPGDILVVMCTTPAYNVVLSLAGGVVTAEGGPMSHAAVLARELGIPAVVGAVGALDEIPDGADIEVDPVLGVVRVLSAATGSLDATPGR
jgi:rifampicin phosphotransferase